MMENFDFFTVTLFILTDNIIIKFNTVLTLSLNKHRVFVLFCNFNIYISA